MNELFIYVGGVCLGIIIGIFIFAFAVVEREKERKRNAR